MTLVTGVLEDVGKASDDSSWIFYSSIRESSSGDSIITSKRVRRDPVDGVLSVELDPGPASVIHFGTTYNIDVPDVETIDLWDLIAAAVAFPPGTPASVVGSAVDAWLDINPLAWSQVGNKPAFIGAGSTAAGARSAIGAQATTVKTLKEFGAVSDGTYDPTSHAVTGTDNTTAINNALASGSPVWVPAGYYRYSSALLCNVANSGLIFDKNAFFVTAADLDRHISVVEGTKGTKWVDVKMLGPHIADGTKFNRALTIGVNAGNTTTSSTAWDASGTWIDGFVSTGYCVGVHIAAANNVQFGTIEVNEAGDSRAEPGAYGISCSGSNLTGRSLRFVNKTTRARHALYYTGPANDCFVNDVYVEGTDLAPIQNRATTGGGQRNGFGRGVFVNCNNNSQGNETTLRGVVNFSCANDVPVVGAGGARIGDYIAINCGGLPGPSIRNMPNSQCGSVQVFGHAGVSALIDHYGSYIFNSDNVRLPLLNFISGFDAAGLNDATFRLMGLENSSYCYGGGIRTHAGSIFNYALAVINSVGLDMPSMMLAGTYTAAVAWSGTTDSCTVQAVTPTTEPSTGLFVDTSTAQKHNMVMRAPGFDEKLVTSGTTVDVAGFRRVLFQYASNTLVSALLNLQHNQDCDLLGVNGNTRIQHLSGGTGEVRWSDGANRALGTRDPAKVRGYLATGANPRCLESTSGKNLRVGVVASAAGVLNINPTSIDQFQSVLGEDITGVTQSGTPLDAMPKQWVFTATGANRNITFGSLFTGNLPAVIVVGRTYYLDIQYNFTLSKWVGLGLRDDLGTIYTRGATSATQSYADTSATTAAAARQAKFMTGTCSTAAATTAKTVTLDSPWDTVTTLGINDFILVKFTSGITASNATLAVNGGAAINIRASGGSQASVVLALEADGSLLCYYDGTYLRPVGIPGAVTSALTQAEVQSAAATSNRVVTPAVMGATFPTLTTVPATATSTASRAGLMAYDSGFLYVSTAVNTWKRVAVAAW